MRISNFFKKMFNESFNESFNENRKLTGVIYHYYKVVPNSIFNYSADDYEKVLLKLKFNNQINDWNKYKIALEKYQKMYLANKHFQELIEQYLNYLKDLPIEKPKNILPRMNINKLEFELNQYFKSC